MQLKKNDKNAAKQYARLIKGFSSYTKKFLENAEACLDFADGEEYIFDRVKGKFFRDTEMGEIKTERLKQQDLYAQIRKLEGSINCRKEKVELLDVTSFALFETLNELNARRIEAETYASCISLYLKDKEAASLNPVCINSFKKRLHPDLRSIL